MNKVLTNSSGESFRRCGEYYRLRYELNLRKLRDEEGEALKVGSLAHKGLEYYLKHGMEKGLEAIEKDDSRLVSDKAKAKAILRAASMRWPDAGASAVEKVVEGKVINPETGSPSRTFSFKGKIDALINGVLVDWKTVANPREYLSKRTIGFQAELYANALKEMGEEVRSIQYRLIARPTIRLKKGESGEGFEERCVSWITDSEDTVLEHETFLSQARLEEARVWLWDTAKAIMESRANNRWMRNTAGCFQWMRPCEYLPICEAACQGMDAKAIEETMYERIVYQHEELEEKE